MRRAAGLAALILALAVGARPAGAQLNYFGQNNFNRSNVTPGLPSAPPFAAPSTPSNPAAPPPNQNPGAQPQGYPYTDQFGQPIPVPPARLRQPPQRNNQNPPNR